MKLFLAAIFAAVALGCSAQDPLVAQPDARKAQSAASAKNTGNSIEMFRDAIAKDFDPALQRFTPAPSEWREKEKAAYRLLLSAGKFEVLVLPTMVRDFGFDRSTRGVFSAKLAIALAESLKMTVADPYLVQRALGSGARQFEPQSAYQLANQLGAKRMVWIHAGHDPKGRMNLTIQVQDAPKQASGGEWFVPVRKHAFEGVEMNQGSAIEAFEKLVPQIVEAMGGKPVTEPVRSSTLGMASLPDTPGALFDGTDNPAQAAYVFLLLEQLTPLMMEADAGGFAQKALLATDRIAEDSPERRVLRARALFRLGYRPAALRTLGTPANDEERAFLAVLNGNLPAVRAAADQEKHPLKRLLLTLEASRIAAWYGTLTGKQADELLAAMKLPGESWRFLVRRALADGDGWAQFPNAELKAFFDGEMPVKGYSLEDIVAGAAVLRDPSKLDERIKLSVIEHGARLLTARAGGWCCQFSPWKPLAPDYHDLIQAIGHDNLLRRVTFLAVVQGSPEAAMRELNDLDASYKGHPYYAVQRSRVQLALARNAEASEREGLVRSASLDAVHALSWEQGQSRISAYALAWMYRAQRESLPDMYEKDIPVRPIYEISGLGGIEQQVASMEMALENSAYILAPAEALKRRFLGWPNPAGMERLTKAMEGRFIGHPGRLKLLGELEEQRGNLPAAIAYYKQNVAQIPGDWDPYEKLGKLLVQRGQVKEAAQLFLSFPGFKSQVDDNRVGTVNHAYEAGSVLYWSGHADLARPLYEIAAKQGTGADGEMASKSRLKRLDGDFHGSLAEELRRVQRYYQPSAFRDYLAMLHVMGKTGEAWAGFSALAGRLREPHIWEAALVGHHLDKKREADIIAWSKQDQFKGIGTIRSRRAAYLVRFATTDRLPSAELAAVLNELDLPTRVVDPHSRQVVRKGLDGMPYLVGWHTGEVPREGLPVKSDLAYFVEAYRALKAGEFGSAASIFEEAQRYYNITYLEGARYMLPYYAIAAAKSGNVAKLEKSIQEMETIRPLHFEYYLAKGTIQVFAGNRAEALQLLSLARYNRPHTEEQPRFTEYVYAEVLEMLAQLTGDREIRAMALDWATQSQKFFPWQSWAYALEATLTSDPARRKRALSMLQYLDPNSERLSKFSRKDVEAAVKEFGSVNPFLRARQAPKAQTPT